MTQCTDPDLYCALAYYCGIKVTFQSFIQHHFVKMMLSCSLLWFESGKGVFRDAKWDYFRNARQSFCGYSTGYKKFSAMLDRLIALAISYLHGWIPVVHIITLKTHSKLTPTQVTINWQSIGLEKTLNWKTNRQTNSGKVKIIGKRVNRGGEYGLELPCECIFFKRTRFHVTGRNWWRKVLLISFTDMSLGTRISPFPHKCH